MSLFIKRCGKLGLVTKMMVQKSMVFIIDQKQMWQKNHIISLWKGVQTNIVHDHVVFNAFQVIQKMKSQWNHDVLEWLFESSIIIIPNCYTCSIIY